MPAWWVVKCGQWLETESRVARPCCSCLFDAFATVFLASIYFCARFSIEMCAVVVVGQHRSVFVGRLRVLEG